MKAITVVAAALAVALVAAAGCGGSDYNDDSGIETSDLSKSEWIAQADQICADTDAKIGQQAGQFFKAKPTPETGVQFADQVVLPEITAQMAQLRDLGAPEGDEEEVDKMFATVEEGLAKAEVDPSALEQGALDPGSALAQQYGLQVCGADDGE